MWIRTQNKQRLINSDQMIDIFIDKTGTRIMVETTRDGDFFTLGEYKDRDTCIKVTEALMGVISSKIPALGMPLGGDTETWIDSTNELVKVYIINDFRIR